jgi:uncharacterized protein (DUF427 family)
MKIAYDHQTFTYQSYGGISRYYTILAGELLKQNQDVVYNNKRPYSSIGGVLPSKLLEAI